LTGLITEWPRALSHFAAPTRPRFNAVAKPRSKLLHGFSLSIPCNIYPRHIFAITDLISKFGDRDKAAGSETAHPSHNLDFVGSLQLAGGEIESHDLTAGARLRQQIHEIHCRIFFERGKNASLPHAGTAAHVHFSFLRFGAAARACLPLSVVKERPVVAFFEVVKDAPNESIGKAQTVSIPIEAARLHFSFVHVKRPGQRVHAAAAFAAHVPDSLHIPDGRLFFGPFATSDLASSSLPPDVSN